MTDEEKIDEAKRRYWRHLNADQKMEIGSMPPEQSDSVWLQMYEEMPRQLDLYKLSVLQRIVRENVSMLPDNQRTLLPFKEAEQSLRPSSLFGRVEMVR